MPIKTEDCVKSIVEYLGSLADPKMWKRVYKNKLPNGLIERSFMSKSTNETICVVSDDDKIYEVNPVNIGYQKKVPASISKGSITTGLLTKVKDIILKMKDDESYIASQYIARELEFASLPKAKQGDGFEDGGEEEDLDFENFELIDINDTTITISAGGDWQQPQTFSASLWTDGKLHYNNDGVDGYNKGGIGTKDLIKRVFGTENPPELEGADINEY